MRELEEAEKALFELTQKVHKLRRTSEPVPVNNYSFQDTSGEVGLRDLFAGKEQLLVIHNMGQACRFCTLWADGLNGFIPHLENHFGLALVSKDTPEVQRQIANDRGWRFKMLSHGGGDYITEQTVLAGQNNMPGIVCYELKDDTIYRKNSAIFGPGDEFCSLWNILSLAGIGEESWVPQYHYWQRPEQMEDGGENLL